MAITNFSSTERSDLVFLALGLQQGVQRLADAAQARAVSDPVAARALQDALVGLVDVTRAITACAGLDHDPLIDVRR
jgi:hypothetical protein